MYKFDIQQNSNSLFVILLARITCRDLEIKRRRKWPDQIVAIYEKLWLIHNETKSTKTIAEECLRHLDSYKDDSDVSNQIQQHVFVSVRLQLSIFLQTFCVHSL